MEDFEELKNNLKVFHEEFDNYQKTGVPRCINCKQEFVNDVDSVTREVSKHCWKPCCKCFGDSFRLIVG